jgi:hypothetical protein
MAYPPPPYADAVCGTPVCGEAICGAWWAYPLPAPLLLGGYDPIILLIGGDTVPPAGLALGGFPAFGRIDLVLVVTQAGLTLGALVPTLRGSYLVSPAAAGLLLGGAPPGSVGRLWITENACRDLTLTTQPFGLYISLPADPETDLVLDPVECA